VKSVVKIKSMKKTTMLSMTVLVAMMVLLMNYSGYSQDKKNAEIKIKTSAVCGMCKDRIEQGLAFEKGIKDVSLDVETKIATVKYNPSKITPDEIRKAISKLGYDADDVLADKTAYDKLPKCCKKDAPEHK
jgi:periplasmic mercuric ion binding protein